MLSVLPGALKMNTNQMDFLAFSSQAISVFRRSSLPGGKPVGTVLSRLIGQVDIWGPGVLIPSVVFVLRTQNLWEVILATVWPFKPLERAQF